MNAVISGTGGRALLIDGESLKSFDIENPSELVVRRKSDVPYLFGEGRDLRFIENAEQSYIASKLKFESDLSLALDLTLISLDEELEEDIRRDAVRDLDELLADSKLREYLEGVLYARPIPEDGDLVGALKSCEDSGVSNSFAFFGDLNQRQSLISKVSSAWDMIPTKAFGGHDDRSRFQRGAVRAGLFRALVIALEKTDLSKFLVDAGLNKTVQGLRNYRQIIHDWSTPFRESGETRIIRPDVEEEAETQPVQRRRHGRRVGVNRQAVLRDVISRKEVIIAAIQRRDFDAVRELVDELVNYQRSSGETNHLAKSLCDLAMEAKALGLFPLQLELTERTIGEVPDDGWGWAQHGDALLRMNRIPAALDAYEQAAAFGAGVVAKTGRAEVLKAQGRFDEALTAFDEVIEQHPENVVAKNGRAEVLKAQGRSDEALTAFDEVIEQHPENVVAKTGRAEVLKAQGRLLEALAAFDEVILQHPESVVAKNGRAEVLKAQGRLPEALAAFDEVILHHPEDVVAKAGRAEVLKAQGRLLEALAAFDEVILQHPESVVAKNGRAEVLKALGRLPEALAALDEVILQHPEDVVAKAGRAEVLKALGRLPEALAAFDEVILQHPESVVAKSGRAEVLKAQGKFEGALRAYEVIVNASPENRIARTGRLSILAATGRYEEALVLLPTSPPLSLDDWIDHHILGMVRLRMGEIAEAINTFNQGIQNSPWHITRQYFRGALALAWLRGHEFRKASQLLEEVSLPLLQPAANVLRIHAFGAEGDVERATRAYEDLSSSQYLRSNDLTQELKHQFILRKPPRRTEEWIFDREAKILLLAA